MDTLFTLRELSEADAKQVKFAEEQIRTYMDAWVEQYIDFYNEYRKDIIANCRWMMYCTDVDLLMEWKLFLKAVHAVRTIEKEKRLSENLNFIAQKAYKAGEPMRIVKSVNIICPLTGQKDSYVVIGAEYYDKEKEKYRDSILIHKSKYPNIYAKVFTLWWKNAQNPNKY